MQTFAKQTQFTKSKLTNILSTHKNGNNAGKFFSLVAQSLNTRGFPRTVDYAWKEFVNNLNDEIMMNANKMILSPDSELRHLPAAQRHQLVGLLDLNENWKLLAAIIPNPDRPNELLLQSTNISILDEQRKRPSGSPSNALLEYWSTYGRKRHTFSEVVRLLEQCGLNRAADLIKNCFQNRYFNESGDQTTSFFIKSEEPHNWYDLPEYSSCAKSNFSQIKPSAPNESLISFETDPLSEEQILESIGPVTISNSNAPIRFRYNDIQLATENFSSMTISQGGTKLGEGSFGEVFRGTARLLKASILNQFKFVAVKRFKRLPIQVDQSETKSGQFLSELNTMYRLQHPNLVRLFGYSHDGPYLCIVTEYLDNGSLQEFWINKNSNSKSRFSLSFEHRLKIALHIASALVYLHEYEEIDSNGDRIKRPYIHRDVKSANIFLDEQYGARLGDLGLVRQGSLCNTSTTVVTNTIIGTSVYMAPEAFRGDVSVKIDTFSYGVVLLELITGMPAFDNLREESDIVSYIDCELGDEFDRLSKIDTGCNFNEYINESSTILDSEKVLHIFDSYPDLNQKIALKLISLAKCCIIDRKKHRPTMSEVFSVLKQITE